MNTDQIKEFFEKDKFAKLTGAVIEEISDTEVVCTLSVNENHFNAGGTVQGGVIFTLADFAFAVACNLEDLKADNEAITVGQSNHILFFRPAKGNQLIAKAVCIQKGNRISVYRIEVRDNSGTSVAEMTGNAYRIAK